jgi:chromosomal replication initiation ATPase DnaA
MEGGMRMIKEYDVELSKRVRHSVRDVLRNRADWFGNIDVYDDELRITADSVFMLNWTLGKFEQAIRDVCKSYNLTSILWMIGDSIEHVTNITLDDLSEPIEPVSDPYKLPAEPGQADEFDTHNIDDEQPRDTLFDNRDVF